MQPSIRRREPGSRRALAIAVLLAAAGPASAVLVIDSGVDTVTASYRIDPGSTVSYTPGLFSTDAPTTSFAGGRFDVQRSHYWWRYHLDGDPSGLLGSFLFESDWIRFLNPVLTLPGLPAGFEFPGYLVALNGDQFSGDNGPCSGPAGPDTSCTGFGIGPFQQVAGSLSGSTLAFGGQQPLDFFGGGFSYRIDASAIPTVASVPVGGTLPLAAAALGLLLPGRRRRAGRKPDASSPRA